MLSTRYLKQVINPIDLAQKILGNPVHKKGFWYKSPFRAEEQVASFEVTEKGFHDFGTGEHYDIISFISTLYNCSFKEAVEKLQAMYGLADNEYDNKRVQEFMRIQRLRKEEYRRTVEKWFVDFTGFVFDQVAQNKVCIDVMKDHYDTLKILYDQQIYLGCLEEEVLKISTFHEKEKLRNTIRREGLPTWMGTQRKYFST